MPSVLETAPRRIAQRLWQSAETWLGRPHRSAGSEPSPRVDGVELVVFDVDHTLVDGSTGLCFALYMASRRLIPLPHLAVAAWWTLGHRIGFVNVDTMTHGAASAFKDMTQDEIRDHALAAYRTRVRPRIYPRARELVDLYRQREIPTLALSGTGDLMAKAVADDLGIDDYIGNRLEMEDGRATGRPLAPYSYGDGKVVLLREFARERDIELADCAAFADSQSDLPVLSAVGYPHAVNPDRKLFEVASTRGWPILYFE